MLTIIAAISENGVIGRGGGLPWRLPADMKRFMRRTSGHAVIMGRRTFESMDGPLPNRRNIVLTSRAGYAPEGVDVVGTLEAAIEIAGAGGGGAAQDGEVFVIGGERVYDAALEHADRLDLTIVHATVEGDTRFPEFDREQWKIVSEERHDADEANEHPFSFRMHERLAR